MTLSLSYVQLYLHELILSFSEMWMTSLKFPAMFSQTTLDANVQILTSLGISVQVTVVWLVVVGQLPQFNILMS